MPTRPSVRGRRIAVMALAGLLLGLPLVGSASGAPGDLDPSFGTGGIVVADITNGDGFNDVLLQPDGKIIGVGSAASDFAVLRFTSTGALDPTFDGDGKVRTTVGCCGSGAAAGALLADGKLLAAGTAGGDFALLRYNSDGSLDTSFGGGDGTVTTDLGGPTDAASAVVVQADGKVVLGGQTQAGFAVARYDADGSLDASFSGDGIVVTSIRPGTVEGAGDVLLQPDGKILLVGRTGSLDQDFALLRYNPDGSLDSSFGGNGTVTTDLGDFDSAHAGVLLPDGKIVAAGSSTALGTAGQVALARYSPDGTLDPTFGSGGKLIAPLTPDTISVAYDLTVDVDGRLTIVGFTSRGGVDTNDFAVARFLDDGSFDPTFGSGGKVITTIAPGSQDAATAMAVQPDGKILAGGFTAGQSPGDFALVRYLGGGTPPTTTTSSSSSSTTTTSSSTTSSTSSTASSTSTTTSTPVVPTTTSPPPVPTAGGYRLAAADGSVFAFGIDFYGSMAGQRLNRRIVGMAATPSNRGYWLVAEDGGIFAFGDARFFGSTGAIRLNQPIVGMAGSPSGNGYWLVAADGGVFAFGDAQFRGSTGNLPLNRPVVGMAASPGVGYWLVASDGGIFAFGDAQFWGSTGNLRLNQPVVGMASSSASGYWLVAADGGIFAFRGARFFGSTGAIRLNQPIVGLAASATGQGYRLAAADGGVFAFGDAQFLGAPRAASPVVAMR